MEVTAPSNRAWARWAAGRRAPNSTDTGINAQPDSGARNPRGRSPMSRPMSPRFTARGFVTCFG